MNEKKLNDLDKLYERFYAMFGRLFRNRKLFDSEKTVKLFAAGLVEQYVSEYSTFKMSYELEELPEFEKLKQRHYELVPRTYRPWYFLWLFKRSNRALKNIYHEIYIETERHFREKEAALERLEKLLDNDEKQTTAFEELTENGEQAKKETSESAPKKFKPNKQGELPGQITLDDVQAHKNTKTP